MDLSRQDYPAMLASLTPDHAIDVLNGRLRQVGRLNTEIADWLQERRRLEEMYSSGIRKLARRPAFADNAELGVFSVPWNSLVNSLETLAESHHTLATKIEHDVEKPLRDFHNTNREMTAMSTISGNLASMAKDIDKAQKSTDRLQTKGNKAATGKVANASSDLENAQQQWDSQAPYVFENLQALDETRLNHLRDVLTQYQTHEVDLVERNRVTAESCLNVLLNVETQDEIKTFVLRTLSGKQRMDAPRNRQSVAFPSPSTTPSFSYAPDEAASQRSGSTSEQTPDTKKPKGLRRLGTVLSRRRESKIPAGADRISESPERKPKTSTGFSSFSSRLGRSRDMPSPLETPHEDARERPPSPLRTMSSAYSVPTIREDESAATNGNFSQSSAPVNVPNGSHQSDLTQLQAPLEPSGPSAPVAEPTKDSEGFSVRPPDADPISQIEQDASQSSSSPFSLAIRDAPVNQNDDDDEALSVVASRLKMQAPPPTASRRAGTVRGRRDMRASVYNPYSQGAPASLPEEPSAPAQTREIKPEYSAPAPISTGAPSSSETSFPSPGALPASTFSPFATSSTAAAGLAAGGGLGAAASMIRPMSRVGSGEEQDNQSIRSGRSLASTSTNSHANKHPELTSPGLNTSIIETVSAWFEDGQVTRSILIGELALAHISLDYAASLNSETIRLENFSALEKVAPNPAFLTPIEQRPGEYTLSLPHISRTAVAFKYQVQLPATSLGSNAPLLITPAWKIEENQTSAIVSYGLNPAFELQGRTSLTLTNVTLVLHIEGAKASGCMSKPVGTFNKERNCIYWQLGDIELSPGAAPTKLLARFATDGLAKQGRCEARWEISGASAAGVGSGLGLSVQAHGGEDDPFKDEDGVGTMQVPGWRNVAAVRKIVSGTYQAV